MMLATVSTIDFSVFSCVTDEFYRLYVLSKIAFVKAARSCSKESPKCSTLYLAQVFGNIVEDSFDAQIESPVHDLDN